MGTENGLKGRDPIKTRTAHHQRVKITASILITAPLHWHANIVAQPLKETS